MEPHLILNHSAIDFDHNVLDDELQTFIANFPPEQLDRIVLVQYLVELLIQHFRHEYYIMMNANYTDILTHMTEHSKLLKDWSATLTHPEMDDLLRIQADLHHHIDTHDRELIKQLKRVTQ